MPEGYPQEDSFIIGDVPVRAFVACLKVTRLRTPITVFVKNKGDAAFTFTVQSSTDNGVSDAYSAINMRYLGASASSIVIQPGGEAEAIIESPVETYLSFYANPQPGSVGILRVFSRYGHYFVRADIGVP